MKVFLSILIFIICANLTIAQTTSIPDPAFEQALINLGLDSGPIDGQVLTANINNVLILNINGESSITDLTGIEGFTSLEELYCTNTSITQINLSQNNELRIFWSNSTMLTSLDLSQNLKIEKVQVINNAIQNLVFQQNDSLIQLYCNGNLIDSLDFSNNLKLEILSCSNNNLSYLNVSQCLNLEQLTCNYNSLDSLDITNCPKLIVFNGVANNLTTLDVSQNDSLTNFQFGANSITSIDVSNNLKLIVLGLEGNQLSQLDVQQNLELWILNCQYNLIQELDLSKNGALGQSMLHNNDLYCLNLKNKSGHFSDFTNNPNLTCVEVDNIPYAQTNYNYDTGVSFSTNCNNACSTVGIHELKLSNLSLYPNPTTKTINIDLGEVKTNLTATLTNSLGQVTFMQQYESTNFIDLDIDTPSGIYFLQLQTENGEVVTKKIIKE